ncbi:uncharacterized protein LOC130589512 [Beta vulgaris subsp. vulgaris]|uniref:uncharacterized protein LOC130589512 n=1 Tax=Beta vulgaris subsp. vulgaris TaxID=3555 RepID=UPI0025466DA4|nr:uncharacterized protein LOC130589512 [Beta vulgaris subsp. vulgaris]
MGHGSTRPLPPALGQRKFLIVAIDYFTKWTEAEPLASITDKQVQAFIWRNIITSEAVLPVEVDIPSPRITFYDFEQNEEEKPVNLDLLPETRGNALLRSIRYKQRVTRQFNRRVKTRPIQLGDWVVRKVEATGLSHLKGKLGANWDGPYKVTKVIKPGTFQLENPEGIPLARPWNLDNLKKYYV